MASEAWTPQAELALYVSMVGLRPVGIHKHFRMVNIYTRLLSRLGDMDISPSDIWKRLEALFNMELLNELEDEYEEDEEDEEEEAEEQAEEEGEQASEAEPNGGNERDEEEEEEEDEEEEEEEEEQNTEEDSEAAAEGDSGKEDAEAARRGAQEVGRDVPATSIGTVLDTSDPQFWRKSNVEFSLPWSEFGALMVERAGAGVSEDVDDMGSVLDAASVASTSKAPSPDPELSDGRASSPVQKRRKGRSATPVPRSRTKPTRSTASSARKKPRAR
ncbi:hypothetical protein GQ54DRAFT_203076 [Martensiomyces pterosporus]|nr:hypothetical protein GQ54DRAFT_203076 [Martensiomyces pterosporus]